jgi:phage baseplate assembly protein W
MNPETVAEIRLATVEALARWEPRIEIEQVDVAIAVSGRFTISMIARFLSDRSPVTISGVALQ